MTSNGCGGMPLESVEASLFREKLYKEEPKMDAAIKSYCSWLLAQQHTGTQQYQKQEAQQLDDEADYVATQMHTRHAPWEITEVLGLARKLSKSINAYVFDIRLDESTERSIVAQVWNEVAAMSTKNNGKPSAGVRITKMLGQTSLIFAWKDLDQSDLLLSAANSNKVHNVQVDDQQQKQEQHETARLFLETFERFLFANTTTTAADDGTGLSCCSSSTFNDAQLIWSPDGGKKELCRRATQRQKVALERTLQQEESQRLRLLQLEQQAAMSSSGSGSAGSSATVSTPTITIIEEGDEKET